jgi:putative endopeptidase
MYLRSCTPRHAGAVALLSLLSAAGLSGQDRPAQQPRPLSKTPRLGLGVDTTHFDRTARPQDDFYRFVNGRWLKNTPMPEDKSRYGSFAILDDKSTDAIKAIVDEAEHAASAPDGSASKKIRDFYSAYMDTVHIEQIGVTPLRPELDRIANLSSKAELPAQFAHLRRVGVATPFGFSVGQDSKHADQYAVQLGQAGLGLPDRDYYLKQDAKFVDTRAKYEAYVARLLTLAGYPNAAESAKHIVALETDLAQHQWDRVRSRDANARYNKMSVADLEKRAPNFAWGEFLRDAGATVVDSVIVAQPDYFEALSNKLDSTPLNDWKSYMTYKLVAAYSTLLPGDFVAANFDFNGRVLNGQPQPRPRDKRAVNALESSMGELIGQLYVERNFDPKAKARMIELVRNLSQAFSVGIDSLEWMSAATKEQAHDKLSKFTVKIAYPDKWRDYSLLEIRGGDPVGNSMRTAEFNFNRMIARLGKPVDRTEWTMTPQTVNAYYSSTLNEIVFPAAILQPPFFNPKADDAVNYGAIGAVIGHEMSHAFDDQGRKSDGNGNLRDWWTAEDAKAFTERAEKLAAQFDEFSPVPGMHVNGHLTLGENIGDLSGLAIAYRAYKMSLHGRPAPIIDGFTGDQRFFLGWAQVWAGMSREDAARQLLLTDPHSPDSIRGSAPLRNIDAFYTAFGVKPGDKMWLDPDKRVKIW